jgi:hypothetical protein
MESAWLVRARWRRRGAWLWPTFVAAIVFDGVALHARPALGDRQSFYGGLLAGLIFSLLAVLFGSRPFGSLLRRHRTDLPVGVARNYGGTFAVILVSVAMLTVGLLHHSSIVNEQRVLDEAIVRAEAFIGDRAPPQFQVNATRTDTYTIQPGAVYRTCVPGRDNARYYCVIVKPRLPFAESVTFAGSEPNATLAQGTD